MPEARQRLPSPLSIDLDDHWAYLRTAGDPGWADYPTFLPLALERLHGVLRPRGIRLTAFVIGQDAVLERNAHLLRGLAADGHELASHSFSHDAAFAYGNREAMATELARAETAISALSGQPVQGYRGPSFSCSPVLLSVLAERGYLYDASTFPTWVGPMARLYVRLFAAGAGQGREVDTGSLFGGMREAFRPLRPYRWDLPGGSLVEVPNTTFPLLRVPIHGTYLHFLADRSPAMALAYIRVALGLCRLTGTPPALLLHASDFLGHDDFDNRSSIPGMRRSGEEKVAFMARVMDILSAGFDPLPLADYVRRWDDEIGMHTRSP